MQIGGIRLAAMACAVPPVAAVGSDAELAARVNRLAATTGIKQRRLAPVGICASDLCYVAAADAMKAADWPKESLDALIFVSQTPDYVLPATSCLLHKRLGLRPACAAFDVNQGCSGYVYGLWIAASLLAAGANRVALLAGDTVSKMTTGSDFATQQIFGDAGSATLLECAPQKPPWSFVLGTDGAGAEHIIVRKGGFRQPHDATIDPACFLEMNGADVFAFTLDAVPSLCDAVLSEQKWQIQAVDSIVMHQANGFMLNHLRKKLGATAEQVPTSIEQFGNTSSASIPLTICSELKTKVKEQEISIVMLGFGVGFSWAGAALRIGPLPTPLITELSGTRI